MLCILLYLRLLTVTASTENLCNMKYIVNSQYLLVNIEMYTFNNDINVWEQQYLIKFFNKICVGKLKSKS